MRARAMFAVVLTCGIVGCCPGPSSEDGARRARAMSPEALEQLYAQMRAIRVSIGEFGVGRFGPAEDPVPAEFQGIGAVFVDVGDLDRIGMGGCFDDKAALIFLGLDGQDTRAIILVPGEWQRNEVLWSDSPPVRVR